MTATTPARKTTRREALCQVGTGMGMLGLFGLLGDAGYLGKAAAEPRTSAGGRPPVNNPLAPRPPHFPAKAKHVIHIYLNGGPSQVDTFDPKPLLKKYDGKMLPQGNLTTERKTGAALPSPFRFQKYGQSGIEVSEIFARTARAHRRHLRDPLDAGQHAQSRAVDAADELRRRAAVAAQHGVLAHLRPGHRERRTCPASSRCAPACRSPTSPTGSRRSCPASTRGRTSTPGSSQVEDLIENIRNTTVTRADQRRQLDLLTDLNRRCTSEPRAEDDALEARIASFELAYRMQMAATDAFDVSQEPQYVRDAYGPGVQARQLLIARRLIERGVRFVQLYHGDVQPWDAHDHIAENHRTLARAVRPGDRGAPDRPQAARAVRGDAGPLRRRVRPHAGRRDGQRQARHGPRPQPLGLHRLAGRRRRQGGHGPRRHRRVRLPGRREAGARPRPARHDPAPARLRPHPADLPLRRPRLPPDRRAWRGRARYPCVTQRAISPMIQETLQGITLSQRHPTGQAERSAEWKGITMATVTIETTR